MSLDIGRLGLSSLDLPDESPQKSPTTQRDLIQKLYEAKKLKDEYLDNCRKLESKVIKLEEENAVLKKLNNSSHKASSPETGPDSASVYAFNSLSKEIAELNKIFSKQEGTFKKCLQSSDNNLEAFSKLQEKVVDYINICKASDLHILKIMNQNQNDKSSASENQRTERMNILEAPSLFEELKEFEEDLPGKHENAILISEAQIARINTLKEALELLKEEIKNIGQKEGNDGHVTKDYLVNYAVKKSISFLNI